MENRDSMPRRPTTVVIVDDSPFFRYQLAVRLNRRGWRVAASLTSGEEAVRQIPDIRPDLVLMDVVMPGLGGLEAVRQLRGRFAGPIVMLSAYSDRGIRDTWKALDAGANDFLAKPSHDQPLDDLVDQIAARLRALTHVRPAAVVEPLRKSAIRTEGISAIVVAASTGGPKAIAALFEEIPYRNRMPIFIVQHMPAGFTHSFAERLAHLSGIPVIEAPADGSPIPLRDAPIVVAAGGRHLRIAANACWTEEGERRHGVIPSADITLLDAAAVFGSRLTAVVLTGMGEDGAEGAHATRTHGGQVIVESQESALVWGMPGTVARNGDADAIWTLLDIRSWLRRVTLNGF